MDISRTREFPVLVHWQQPRCLLGAGASEMAAPQAAAMGLKHVLFVTSGLKGTGIVEDLKGQFEAAGVAVTMYDKVESNPKDYNVMDAHQLFNEESCGGLASFSETFVPWNSLVLRPSCAVTTRAPFAQSWGEPPPIETNPSQLASL